MLKESKIKLGPNERCSNNINVRTAYWDDKRSYRSVTLTLVFRVWYSLYQRPAAVSGHVWGPTCPSISLPLRIHFDKKMPDAN